MKKTLLYLLSLLILLSILLVISIYLPLPVTPYMDFQVIYLADKGILHGVDLYDQAGQAQWIADASRVSVKQVSVFPFPYPPWYALALLPLALLPIHAAARMWFLLNMVSLIASVWLLTDGWQPRRRMIAFLGVFSLLPVLGALFIGQYVFPVILGMAMIHHALKHKHVIPAALGMMLVTFKPHIGVYLLLATLTLWIFRRDNFNRRVFLATSLGGVFLFFAGFLADPAWPVTYFRSLFEFKDASGCHFCLSLPFTTANLLGMHFDQTAVIAMILFAILASLFVIGALRSRNPLLVSEFVAFFACVPLLVTPYLFNYDHAVTLVPMFYLAGGAKSKFDWLWIAAFITLPWLGLLVFKRAGNPVLLASAFAITVIILTRMYKRHTITS